MLEVNIFHLANFGMHGPGGGSPLAISLNSTTGQGIDAAVATGDVLGGVAVFVGESSGGGPVPTAKVLQGGIVGTAYSETISAQGGTAPYTFAVSAGSLPAGLALDGATGVISGMPAAAATSDFTIRATDSNGSAGSTDFEIDVAAAASGLGGAKPNYCIVG